MFVTCMVDEDLPYVLRLAGEDNLMIGSDYTHRDQSMEYEYERLLRERVDQGEISASVMRKILYDNPKEAYGL
jgi:predicted TIM-barrel fold metal-dependent hydrolase